MNVWIAAALALTPPLVAVAVAAARGAVAGRLVAVQLATSIGVFLAVVLSFVDDQASSIDLALTLALLALPASLLFALFEERWL